MDTYVSNDEIRYQYDKNEEREIAERLSQIQNTDKKFVVIDDDPTGGQTVHDIMVYTSWSKEILTEAFATGDKMFFIMTNSRSMQGKVTQAVHKEIVDNLVYAARKTRCEFEIISRSDSTLRGHYPLETETIYHELYRKTGKLLDGEIIMPCFPEGGRYTIGDIHYLLSEGQLYPVSETEFARDKSFGFKNSDLKLWIEEKSKGRYRAEKIKSISLEMLRKKDYEAITQILMSTENFEKIIVNATCYTDIKVFCVSYFEAIARGKSFLARTAAAWPKVVCGIRDIPFLDKRSLCQNKSDKGGLIVVGSHVNKTTEQLNVLKKSAKGIAFVEFNQHLAVQKEGLEKEVQRVAEKANQLLNSGITTVIYTRRERIDLGTQNADDELILTNRITDAVTEIVKKIQTVPKFIIAKGGITASDIAVKALHVKKALIMGQIYPGIPVWKLGDDSRYSGVPYIVFPGNVGTKTTLRDIVSTLLLE